MITLRVGVQWEIPGWQHLVQLDSWQGVHRPLHQKGMNDKIRNLFEIIPRWVTLTGEFTSARLAILWDKAEQLWSWKVAIFLGEGFIYLNTSLEISIEKETGNNFQMFESDHRVKLYGRRKQKTWSQGLLDVSSVDSGPNGNMDFYSLANSMSYISYPSNIFFLGFKARLSFLFL